MELEIHQSVPRGMCLALYKGNRPGLKVVGSYVGRYLDRGPYSHSELKCSNGMSYSSSIEDGGVRGKHIQYSSVGNWDFLPLPDPQGCRETLVVKWYEDHAGLEYDTWGNIRFATNFARDSPLKWFCTESNMAALGFPEAYRYGPSGAATLLSHLFNTPIIKIDKTFGEK